jgi:ubiquinone/menaquinone biosynthesis C-methylase UbiE
MDIKRKFYYSLKPQDRQLIRRIYYAPVDLWQNIFQGPNKVSVPPKGLIYTGSGDFIETGNHFLNLLKAFCHLLPNHTVLDIGCGIGRIALPLTKYLDSNGKYYGFDIVKTGIDWCNVNISKRFLNFHFEHFNLRNDLYSEEEVKSAKDFIFPYNDETFDVIISTSVFTHMMPEDMEQYISEISRVIKKNGNCLFTFFILNQHSETQMVNNPIFNFTYKFGHYSLMYEKVKEANVAYREIYLKQLFDKFDFKLERLLYGHWSHGDGVKDKDFQDLVILTKL